jgi:probable HAF family extracellular repeat protein
MGSRPGGLRSSHACSLTIALVAVALFGRGAPAQSPPSPPYGLMPVGTLGGSQSHAYDLAELGQAIAGRAQTASGAYHAFAQGAFGLKDLGTLGGADSTAFAVTSQLVVGQAQTASGDYHAFAFDLSTNAKTDLGTLGGNWSAAYDARYGIIVGASRTPGNARLQAFQYVNGTMSAIPVNLGGDSVARGVSLANDIVGHACTAGNASCRPFLLSGGVLTLLGASNRSGVAVGVNLRQDVVGSISVAGSTAMHAFLYSGGSLVDLGTLGGASSEARGVNELGEVVGSAQNAAGQPRAFLWRGGQMIDLNTFRPAGSEWVLESAASISDGGQIVGYGSLNGKRRAFLLTPPTDLRAFIGGTLSQADSNLPRGIEVGQTVEYTTSVLSQSSIGRTIYGARMIHTLTGPAVFVSARTYNNDVCEVTATVVTCRLQPFDSEGLGREVELHARATAPGAISHQARVVSDIPDPNPANDIITEPNRAIALAGLTLAPASIAGGKISVAQVTLTGQAPAGDAIVRLSSSRPDIASVPATFVVPSWTDHRELHIVPAVVSAPTTVQISATYGLVTLRRTLTVVPPALSQLYLNPTTVIGGCGTSQGRVVLTGKAGSAGLLVPLSNTNTKATVPASVTVPSGADSVSFAVTTAAVTAPASGTVSASAGGVSQSLTLTVRPIRAQTLTLSSTRVRGGTTVSGTVRLECPAAPGPVAVTFTSSNSSIASPTLPGITLAAGATTGSFAVATSPVASETTVTIYAWVFGVRKGVALTVTP